MTKEELKALRSRFKPRVGDRVKFTVPERGGWSYGFGDVIKVNRTSVKVLDSKFGTGDMLVDLAFISGIVDPKDLIKINLT